MKVPFTDMSGQIIEILDSRDLTDEEWALVKKNKNGALSMRDLPNNERAS
jgi:hypothetical protein